VGYPPSDRPISAQFCPSLALRKSESFRGAASSGLTPRKWGSQMFPRSQGDVLGAFGCWEQPGLLKMIFTSKKSSGFQLWESVGYILDYFGVLEYLDLSVHCEKMIWPSFNATHHRIETFNVEVSHCISENASAAYRALCFFDDVDCPSVKSHLKNCAQKLPANQLHEIFVAFVDWCHLGNGEWTPSDHIGSPDPHRFVRQGGSSSFYVTRRRLQSQMVVCFSLSWCVFPC